MPGMHFEPAVQYVIWKKGTEPYRQQVRIIPKSLHLLAGRARLTGQKQCYIPSNRNLADQSL